jgi:hypothetical protein
MKFKNGTLSNRKIVETEKIGGFFCFFFKFQIILFKNPENDDIYVVKLNVHVCL